MANDRREATVVPGDLGELPTNTMLPDEITVTSILQAAVYRCRNNLLIFGTFVVLLTGTFRLSRPWPC